MKTLPRFLLLLGAVLTSAGIATAAELGDPAAALQIAEWVKGTSVEMTGGKGKAIYVIEFWATWSVPCRACIAPLNELQKKFKDKGVVFVGVSDEKPDVVKAFVKQMGDKMDYAVAVDSGTNTASAYLGAYQARGIPRAFVVDKDGKVVWHGHPMIGLEQAIQGLLDGKFDLAKEKKRAYAQNELLPKFMQVAADDQHKDEADRLGKELESLDKELDGIVPGQKFNTEEVRKQLKFNKALTDYRQAIFAGKEDSAADALAAQVKDYAPDKFDLADFKQGMRLEYLFQQYATEATGPADDAKLADLAKKLGAVECKQTAPLNEIAWFLLTDPRIKKRDPALAAKFAKAAYDLCASNDFKVIGPNGEDQGFAVLDTYARALFDTGKVPEAIATVKKAIELCKNPAARADLEATLKRYESKQSAK